MQLDISQLCELLTAFDRTEISELTLKSGDFELTVRKEQAKADASATPQELANLALATEPTAGGTAAASASQAPAPTQSSAVTSPPGSTPATQAVAPEPTASTPSALERKWVEVNSPMVGTFYRAPAPDEPPFVEVGDRITTGQTVCIIEAMKLMNEIEAEVSGQVMEVLVENGSPVEYGQPLMRINPS